MRPLSELAKRIEDRCEKITETGCWIWMFYTNSDGYGKIWWDGKSNSSHRTSYLSFVGPIPSGLLVCHRCDIPECCNPHHLFLGTDLENTRDKIKKGRFRAGTPQRGEQNVTARWTDEQILAIRADTDSQRVIAKKYGTSQGAISQIKNGKIWAHVSNDLLNEPMESKSE
ncbi:HNH endonuclease signature motif containing protein [Paraburkholderia sp. BR10872]|uniref:HNH endonuclease signature motif containing protein n=1 Tax=Paraburkholderia sp. BR10872 TaxID=3236989 RepID=UPI0034D1EC5B